MGEWTEKMIRSGSGWRKGHVWECEKGFKMSVRESEWGKWRELEK